MVGTQNNAGLWDKFLRVEPLFLVTEETSELRATVAAPGSLLPYPSSVLSVPQVLVFLHHSPSTPRCPGMARSGSRYSPWKAH